MAQVRRRTFVRCSSHHFQMPPSNKMQVGDQQCPVPFAQGSHFPLQNYLQYLLSTSNRAEARISTWTSRKNLCITSHPAAKAASLYFLLIWDDTVLKTLSQIVLFCWEKGKSLGWFCSTECSVSPRTLKAAPSWARHQNCTESLRSQSPPVGGHNSTLTPCSSATHRSISTQRQNTYFWKQEQFGKFAKYLVHLSDSVILVFKIHSKQTQSCIMQR